MQVIGFDKTTNKPIKANKAVAKVNDSTTTKVKVVTIAENIHFGTNGIEQKEGAKLEIKKLSAKFENVYKEGTTKETVNEQRKLSVKSVGIEHNTIANILRTVKNNPVHVANFLTLHKAYGKKALKNIHVKDLLPYMTEKQVCNFVECYEQKTTFKFSVSSMVSLLSKYYKSLS